MAGIHCGSTASGLAQDDAEATAGPPSVAPAQRPAAATSDDSRDDDRPAPVRFLGDEDSSVTSRAVGDDGVSYVAGLFSGALAAGGATLRSHGGDDVFVARLERNGRVAWARAVGSKHAESSPRVTFRDGQVKLMALAGGEVDCGQGPLNTWSSDMFFLCVFGADGEPLNGGTFPTGEP
jgi:hypothetical protein